METHNFSFKLHAMVDDAISNEFVFQNADFHHQLAAESNDQIWNLKLRPNGGDVRWLIVGEWFDDHIVLLQVLDSQMLTKTRLAKGSKRLTL